MASTTMIPLRRPRPRDLAAIGIPWLIAYGTLQTYWRLGHRPAELSPVGDDLVFLNGWGVVGLCGAAVPLLAALAVSRPSRAVRRLLLLASWATAITLVSAAAMVLLDVVGGILPGLGIEFFPLGALSRAGCLGGGVIVGMAALSYQRATRAGCAACGRAGPSEAPERPGRTPVWAFAAAYGAVAGCAVRIGAQAVVGFDESPLASGVSVLLFELGFLLGGTLLPLSLVHSWGRVWPRWVPGLAGRRVPRRLVLWPAAGISAGLVVYFGLMLLQMIAERLQGRNPFPPSGGLDLPEAFFWFAVPSYLAWGAGMAVAAFGYHRLTRRACGECGR
ncbi:hypothetical protein [Actinomadura rugatobispora]|uniref:DUF3995 domain-containing protein n=1 Tax=Actinomadura rugatobispora TaxID=1994 RepID=A0ABW1AC61_9ACTN|nr:hypothetical protein GCM10010200_099590 [Actinomadura rugatobispora]